MQRGYVETQAGTLHWRCVEGPGPPVVLLHRTPVSSASFEGVLRSLQGRRAALAFDTPGFGQSFRPDGRPSAVDYAKWFLAALDALETSAFHLFGHHTGTHFAAEMARLAPERVLSLTLSGVLYVDAGARARFRHSIGDAPAVDRDGAHLAAVWRKIAGLYTPFDPVRVGDEVLGALASPEGCDQAFDAIFEQDFARVLSEVAAPVRVFEAQDDPIVFCLEALKRDQPQIPIALHAPAGLAAPERRPAAIANALLSYTGAPHAPPPGAHMTDRTFQLRRTPAGFDLERGEAATPVAGPGEVLIRVYAVSLNRRDVSIRDLSYPVFGDAFSPCSDAAGEIVAVGEGVADFGVGDRVTSTFFQNWPDGRARLAGVMSALGSGGRGVLADHVVLDAGAVAPIPNGLGFEAAATLPCAAVTAWSGLFTHGRLEKGDWVLVLGTGGVALFGLQLATAAGARVAVVSSSEAKLARAQALGAELTINYATTSNWDEAVRDATGGVDHVLELGGAGTLAKSAAALGVGGHMALIGALDGFGGDLSAAGLVMGAQRVTAIAVGSRAEHLAAIAFIERHRIQPQIDSVFDLDAIEAAYARMAQGAFGKVVVRLS